MTLHVDNVLSASDVVLRWPRVTRVEFLFEFALLWETLPQDDGDDDAVDNRCLWTTGAATDFWGGSSRSLQSIMDWWTVVHGCSSSAADVSWLSVTTLEVTGSSTDSCVTTDLDSGEELSINMSRISSEMTRRSSSMSLVYKHTVTAASVDGALLSPVHGFGTLYQRNSVSRTLNLSHFGGCICPTVTRAHSDFRFNCAI